MTISSYIRISFCWSYCLSTNRPYVSVLIPMYNRERFIIQAINSVLNQKFQNFEIIIVDDGSQDRSVELAKSFEDKRIVIH